jgi:hypothetical protein
VAPGLFAAKVLVLFRGNNSALLIDFPVMIAYSYMKRGGFGSASVERRKISMTIHKFLLTVLLCAALPASAAVIVFNDRAAFEAAAANIAYNSNFDDFSPRFSFPGDPFYRGGVTYTSGGNVIVGTGTIHDPIQNAIFFLHWTPLTGDIDSGYTLFGFDLAQILSGPDYGAVIAIEIHTSAGQTFVYPANNVPLASEAFQFWGFALTGGQYFSSFSITAPDIWWAPGITNVTLGTYVPEPSSMALMLIGLGGLAAAGLRRRRG